MRVAVVTGASSGLGREYVKLIDRRSQKAGPAQADGGAGRDLAADGFVDEIWVIARRRERLEELQKEVRTPLRVIPMDLTDSCFEEQIEALYEAKKPEVVMLVNSAGFGKIGSYADVSNRDAGKMVDLNCKAPVLMCQLTIPYMPAGARILNVCSTAGFSAFQYLGIYCATKSFLYRYSRALRVELLSRHISVTAVCPYWVKDTEFIPVAEDRLKAAASSESTVEPEAAAKSKPEVPGTGRSARHYIHHFIFSSKKKSVAAWSMTDTWHRFAVSTPGPVCTLHRIFAKIIPNELMAGIWAILRRV